MEPTKKSLGQHWLDDRLTLGSLLEAGEITDKDTVLEIGPGLGSLTRLLADQARKVVAVEKDAELATRLQALKTELGPRLEIVIDDILRYDLMSLPAGYKVVANIPYYLTSNLLRRLLEGRNPAVLMALMVQKEVAERITASPGRMSVLSFSVQYYAKPSLIALVPKELFQPPPKVDSAILQIKRRLKPAFKADSKALFRIVKAGFASRRKQLKNSLAAGLHLSPAETQELLLKANISPQVRAQDLSLDEWGLIYRQFQNLA